jgi:PAS domain S-box-containing protein
MGHQPVKTYPSVAGSPAKALVGREDELFHAYQQHIFRRTDRLFAGLMACQWLAAIAVASWLSPLAWAGPNSERHLHVGAALLLGGTISLFPMLLALSRPGQPLTRHVIAIGQMLMSALLIHLTGGRIETHFHVFGSLALLSFYRDWRVLVSATVVVALDHFVRGFYFPQSVYGVLTSTSWRAIEHAGWVIFENIFLVQSCRQSMQEMRDIAVRQALLEASHASVEQQVEERTAALERSEARFQAIFDAAPIGIARVDLRGQPLETNRALQELLGYSAEELRELSVTQLIHPEDRETASTQSLTMAAGKLDRYQLEKRYLQRDGRVIPVQLCVQLVRDEHGVPQFSIEMVQDISEQRQLEEQFRQVQKMECVGRLAGGVAHDFNNLLSVINGYAELLVDAPSPRSFDTMALNEIRSAGERAAGLTRQLLAFSRRQVLAPQQIDLRAVVEANACMLRRLIGEDVQLVTVLESTPLQVLADPGQIEQVLMNLAVNARDAMPCGGKLTIEAKPVTLGAAYAHGHMEVPPGQYVLVAVSDTGCGMDAQTLAQIFEPFFTTKEVGKGTGLGLATVYGIVRQSSGHIFVYSEPSIGTTFKIYLPRLGASVPPPSDETTVPLSRGDETVLLVEDEPAVRKLLRASLETYGYTVLDAGSALEALDQWATTPRAIDLVVTDVVMPGMSGRELVEQVRRGHPEMKVLFMSGYTDDAVVRHGILTAEMDFLQKPFSPATLAQRIRSLLHGPNSAAEAAHAQAARAVVGSGAEEHGPMLAGAE